MSSYALQKVTALLIRRPDSYRGEELEGFLNGFELTDHERKQARAMACDPKVEKYGRLMGSSRETRVTNLLRQSKYYISDDLIRHLWRDLFEPVAIHTRYNQLPTDFLKFLIENEGAKAVLAKEAPPFVPDMLKFEMGLSHFRMKIYSEAKAVPKGSDLKHVDFVLMRLGYDLQPFRAQLIKANTKIEGLEPKQRDVRLLFIRKDATFDARIFEIDEPTYAYLEAQSSDPSRSPARPSGYDSLVKVGLCQEGETVC